MKFLVTLLSITGFIFLLTPSVNAATVDLEKPEALLAKAEKGRIELREVILTIQTQLPEMRDQRVFESYFMLLDPLQVLAEKHSLDDIYPEGVKLLGHRMSLFGVKWMDLSRMDEGSVKYYTKWMNIPAFELLLSTTTYNLKGIQDTDRLKKLVLNIEYIINTYVSLFSERLDLTIGFKDLSSSIASKYLVRKDLSKEDFDFWFSKIYTSSGFNFYLDLVQNEIYSLSDDQNTSQKTNALLANFPLVLRKSKQLTDSGGPAAQERVFDQINSLIKRAFEVHSSIDKNLTAAALDQHNARATASLTQFILSLPEPVLIQNPENLKIIGQILTKLLVKHGLTSEQQNFEQFIGRITAGLEVREKNIEGTYTLKSTNGMKWKFTILTSSPFDVSASLATEDWYIKKNFFKIRYSPEEDLYTGTEGISDSTTDPGYWNNSMIQFKIKGKEIEIFDLFSLVGGKMKGSLTEPLPSLNYSNKVSRTFSAIYKGSIKFKLSNSSRKFDLAFQSSGITVGGRLRDQYGPVYDFTSGFIAADGTVVMNTGRLAGQTWVQLRGKLVDDKLTGQIIIAGRGISTEPFTLVKSNSNQEQMEKKK